MSKTLDNIDRKILKALQEDGRISVTDLSTKVGLSNTPCTERIKRLERKGYVTGYHAQIAPEMVDLPYLTFVQITLERTTTEALEKFNAAARRVPEIESCHMIAGGFDYLLKVRTRDMAHYRRTLAERVATLPHVTQTHTYPIMETVKDNRGVDPLLF